MSRTMVLLVIAACGVFGGSAENRPAFEVASIKPGDPSSHGIQITMGAGGRLVTKNVPVKMLITFAYDIRENQLSGGPGWISTDRYDIVAKPESGEKTDPDKVKLMVQTLLADRFKLKFHHETKEMGIYALVVARNGPKMKESAAGVGDGPRGPMMRMGRGELTGQKVPIDFLARHLSNQLGRSVVDKTELKGSYDFTLHWTPEEGETMGPRPPGGPEAGPPPDAAGPTIFTALREQLGLKLESQRGQVEMYVIDSVEKPTEN